MAGVAHTIEFGPGGPRVRLFIGEPEAVAALPAPVLAEPRRRVPIGVVIALAIALVIAVAAWLVFA